MAGGSPPKIDLQALAAKANSRLEQQHASHQAALSKGASSRSWGWIGLGMAALVAIVLLLSSLNTLKAAVGLVSDSSRDADLTLVLESARKAVEENRRINGEIPARVPLPALDALVNLERTANGYRLATQMNGRVAVMDENGGVIIERLK